MRQRPDLWQRLQEASRTGRPIVMYGMGNGADKILAVCESRGIAVSDFFASDGFVRGHAFHGKVVLSYAAVKDKYADRDPLVLIAFASARPDVLALMERVATEFETYIPDVPVSGTELFDASFYEANRDKIAAARALFADEESRRVYDGILRYKMTGRMDILRDTESDTAVAMREILHAETFRVAADLGAYNGDSIRALRAHSPELSAVVAMEPDRRNFKKLDAYATALRDEKDPLCVLPIEAGAWFEDALLMFHESGNRNATLTDRTVHTASSLPSTAGNPYFGKTAEVPVRALDAVVSELRASGALVADLPLDYIKYDVEGAERGALLGSRALIRTEAPALLVSVYHRSGDLFELPLLVRNLGPDYRLYLRRDVGVPAWDIHLYAVKE